MHFITSEVIQRFLEQDKRKFEGLFPELIKRLILNSCQCISNIRIGTYTHTKFEDAVDELKRIGDIQETEN